jgi:hypothetical protein
MKRLGQDEARIAATIAKLPELLKPALCRYVTLSITKMGVEIPAPAYNLMREGKRK